jgi:Domain of unknown function (DUF4440)
MEITQELIRIERTLWTNNADVYQEGYLADAVLIFPVVGRIGRDTAVAAIREENGQGRHWAEVRFEDISTLSLGADAVLLTYRALARWNYEDKTGETLCGTVYVRSDGAWKVAFHQQTAV